MKSSIFIPVIGLTLGLLFASTKYNHTAPRLKNPNSETVIRNTTTTSLSEAALEGEQLFRKNCATCHKVNRPLIGPPLNVALENWDSDKEAMYLWIRNWQDAVEAGYPRALKVLDYSPTAMNTYPNMTDEELDAIFEYVEAVS